MFTPNEKLTFDAFVRVNMEDIKRNCEICGVDMQSIEELARIQKQIEEANDLFDMLWIASRFGHVKERITEVYLAIGRAQF